MNGKIDYYKILGIEEGASLVQIKRAYREKARIYHPDLNKREEAADIFIAINEAYEYLSQREKIREHRGDEYERMVKAWQEYRRQEARKRARYYSRERYKEFTRSKNFKTSMVFDKVQLIINLSFSLFIITMALIGYKIKLNMVDEGFDPPAIGGFIFLLSIGVLFSLVSIVHLIAFYQTKRKIDSHEKKNK